MRTFAALILISGIILGFEFQAWGREVNSREDEIRLSGYREYLKGLELIEKKRISDVDEIAREKARDWDVKEKALREYKRDLAHRPPPIDEKSPEWKEYVKEKMKVYSDKEKSRDAFVKEKRTQQVRERKIIDLSEEQELSIADQTPRVAWNKRKFSDGASGGGSSGGYGSLPTFTPPPTYTNNNPGYFDAPPPPPVYEPYDEGMYPPPPPPPPPMFEEEPPF